jgi:quinoprotein glucose dehydrogenase
VAWSALIFTLHPLQGQDWSSYAGDPGSTHYSALAQIDRGNVANLKPLWEWKTGEEPLPEFKTIPGAFEATPLKIGKTLYLSTPYNRVVALDEATGRELWSYDPKAYRDGQVPNGTGFVHRGVGAWRDSRTGKLRLLMNSRYRLIQLDAETGIPVAALATTVWSTWSKACAGKPIPKTIRTRRPW